MIFYYKNSLLASILSVLGCVFLMVLIIEFESYTAGEIIPMGLLSIGLLVSGKLISNEKAFKTWWKSVKEAGLEERIKTDPVVAEAIYQKNPKKRTLKEIEKINPAAAELIAAKHTKK